MSQHLARGTSVAVLVVLLGTGVALGGGVALAQGGGPAVDWWVISGGGGPSGGTGVTLNDTLGQPVIGPSSGAGSIRLAAGYWTGSCLAASAAVPTVNVVVDGDDVMLAWGADPHSAAYQVWVETAPYFDADAEAPATTTTSTTYPDTGAAASLENHFYVVHGVNACGAASADSIRTGEFTFGLTPGTG